MKTSLSLLFALTFWSVLPTSLSAQIVADFEDGLVDQWVVELDGVINLSTLGNPGNCLEVDDQAIGAINQLVAPFAFTGDWSAAGPTDSIRFDLYARRISGTLVADGFDMPLVTLSGPGGTATALFGFVPVLLTWQTIAIPLDSNHWDIQSGSWDAILQDVEIFRIRTEYVDGSEETRLDNIRIPVSPVRETISETLCTEWSTPGEFEGWSFQDVASAVLDTTMGLPPGAMRIGDRSGVLSYAVAPPRYLGSWALLDGQASLSLDVRVNTGSSSLATKPYTVRLSGPGGVAFFQVPDAEVLLALNAWHSFTFPLMDTAWELQSGTWTGLLDLVTEVRIGVEFINGSETVFLDNFCLLVNLEPCTLAPDGLSAVGNANGSVSLSWDPLPGSVACRVRGRVDGTGTWRSTPPVIAPEPTGKLIPASVLVPGQTYEWQVQCACSLSPLELSPWSLSGLFTAPVLRLQAADVALQIQPNPAQTEITVQGLENGSMYRVFNLQGAVVLEGRYNTRLDISALHPGWYILQAGEQNSSFVKAE